MPRKVRLDNLFGLSAGSSCGVKIMSYYSEIDKYSFGPRRKKLK
jgi:hypothetical protein